MAKRIKFSKSVIDKFPAPKQGRVYVYDSDVRGLAMLVTDAGAKSFYLYRKLFGRPIRAFICKWPDLTIDDIRQTAEEMNVKIAKGEDPRTERKQARQCSTLGELFDYYLEVHAKPHKTSWKFDEWQFNRFLKSWRSRRLDAISTGDLQTLHAKIGRETGTIPANRLRSLLHTMFKLALRDKTFKGENPARDVKRFTEHQRNRYLTPEELPKFLQAVDAEPNDMLKDFFRLALFTGARRGNLQSARWEEIDLKAGVWTIPAEKAKGKKTIPVPLSEEALEVLRRRYFATTGSEWVFPSVGKTGHLTEPKGAWKRICKKAGLEGVRLHDLRHTTASWMIARGTSLYVVGKALGHANQATTQRYAHLELSDIRAALGGATAAMAESTKPKPKATKKAKAKKGASNG